MYINDNRHGTFLNMYRNLKYISVKAKRRSMKKLNILWNLK